MVPYSEVDWAVAEGSQLMRDKIRPGRNQVGTHARRLRRQAQLGGRRHIFVNCVDGSKISEVPIEVRAILLHTFRDRGHNNVAAVSRISRDGKLPGGRWSLRLREATQAEGKQQYLVH
jgi:hypothetical protein